MNRYRIFHIGLIVLCLILLCPGILPAQKNNAQVKTAKKAADITITVIDQAANPITDAKVWSAQNRRAFTLNAKGQVSFRSSNTDMLKVVADGYKDVVIVAPAKKATVTMESLTPMTGASNQIYGVGYTTNDLRSIGSVSKMDAEKLTTAPAISISNALGGRLMGYFTRDASMNPGFSAGGNSVRSSHGNIITLVDGVERDLQYLDPEVVESVQLLKDASFKALYGGRQANGILMVTTKRGKAYENGVHVTAQSGIQTPTRLPQYLDSYQYTKLHNEAMINSGLDPLYANPENYIGKGHSDQLYPNVDFYDMFLKDYMKISTLSAQISGGNEKTRYFAHMGYRTNGDFFKNTKEPHNSSTFIVRTNVDNQLLDFLTFSAGFNAALDNENRFNVGAGSVFSALSSTRPNEYPIFVPGADAGVPKQDLVLGGTVNRQNNPYGLLNNRGLYESETIYIQSDFALNIDLNKWVKGLKIRPMVTFDVANILASNQAETFSVYQPYTDAASTNDDAILYNKWGTDSRETKKTLANDAVMRNYAFDMTMTYDRSFGAENQHSIFSVLRYMVQSKEYHTLHQKARKMNLALTANYAFKNRYIAEGALSGVAVGSFAPAERYRVFPTAGLGWILSNEDFMKGSSKWLDYLKLRGSYGILGFTNFASNGLYSSFYYRDEWSTDGAYGGSGRENSLAFQTQLGNPELGYQKSYELNIGVDAKLFNNSTWVSLGYFNNKETGLFTNLGTTTPSIIGGNEALPTVNYKEYKVEGGEGEITYTKKINNWRIEAGVNATYGYGVETRGVDINYPDSYAGLRTQKRLGNTLGLEVIGTFADQQDIENSAQQLFGSVAPGDLKYRDRNEDGVVDNKDRVAIANTNPNLQYGISVNIRYKNFWIDILGYGLGAFDAMLTSEYYQNSGNNKYSQVVIDGLPNGNPHPIRRASASNNNYVNSDYWVVNGSFFKLRNVEIGYEVPYKAIRKVGLTGLKVFARGSNLWTISKIKDLDPESLSAGLGSYPLFSTFTAGLSLSF